MKTYLTNTEKKTILLLCEDFTEKNKENENILKDLYLKVIKNISKKMKQ